MRRKAFSVVVLIIVCSISLFAVTISSGYVSNLFDSVKDNPISKILSAAGEKSDSQKTSTAERKIPVVAHWRQTAETTQNVPDEIVYFVLFNHLVGLKKQSEQLQATGNNPIDYYGLYKEQANLDQSQSESLFQTARNCMDAVSVINTQAKSVIDQARAAFPDGAMADGQNIPPPPVELIQLQQQKDDTVLYYRDQLRNSLGETKFVEFNQFARDKVAPQVENLPSGNFKVEGEAK